jgi:gas vesicle protein|tara:strand:+ start:3380 stop:4561 length:1182 start_codon:yes stop_codon:yes gene_type:complete
MSFITAAIIGAVATAGATAYSSKQARKAQKKAREDQQLRDLIEGAAPNISAVEEIIAEEIGQQDAALLDDALKQMDYQTQQAQEGADFAAQAQADQALQQALTEEEALQLLQQQGGIAGMARGGPIGTPNDTYYFSVPQVMQMMKDPNPQIQGVGIQLADQMTSTPGMSMVPATPDQIRSMAYGGQVEPKKLADGDVVDEFSVADLGDGLYDMRRLGSDGRHSQYREITYERPLTEDEGGWPAERVREFKERRELFGKLATPYVLAGEEIPDDIKRLNPELPVEYPPVRIESEQASRQSSKPYYDDGGVVTDPDPMNQVIKDLLVSQIPGVSQARALKDVKEAEGLEKLVEALDLAPINPVKLGRGMKERIAARRAARRAAEEEAESRVFGPR